jgi:hypothetical protein
MDVSFEHLTKALPLWMQGIEEKADGLEILASIESLGLTRPQAATVAKRLAVFTSTVLAHENLCEAARCPARRIRMLAASMFLPASRRMEGAGPMVDPEMLALAAGYVH